mmetsp:Transcript_19910/g.37457  ORF Transcript_19910/g.37457 Transcript_19910/m.37457 type:complete len:228 (+) Transcript_19910:157-840(+)
MPPIPRLWLPPDVGNAALLKRPTEASVCSVEGLGLLNGFGSRLKAVSRPMEVFLKTGLRAVESSRPIFIGERPMDGFGLRALDCDSGREADTILSCRFVFDLDLTDPSNISPGWQGPTGMRIDPGAPGAPIELFLSAATSTCCPPIGKRVDPPWTELNVLILLAPPGDGRGPPAANSPAAGPVREPRPSDMDPPETSTLPPPATPCTPAAFCLKGLADLAPPCPSPM